METNKFIQQFASLSYDAQQDLLHKLKNTLSESKPILSHRKISSECIYCKSVKVYKHGKYSSGAIKYRCQECKKCFNALTGTSIHYIKKKELWDRFIGLMIDSKSIRHIAAELELSTKTVFEWRHKVLSSFEKIFIKEFNGEVEIDPIYFRFNQKGRKSNLIDTGRKFRGISKQQATVLLTMDRNKVYDFQLVKFGKLYEKDLEKVIDKSKFNKVKVVYSDSERCIINYFQGLQINHKTFVAKEGHGKGKLHVNTLNNTKARLSGWIDYHFNSVSTKYLKNYLNWFAVLEILKKKRNKTGKVWDYILYDGKTYERNKDIENNYQDFLKGLNFSTK
jgi:transposase-like protein